MRDKFKTNGYEVFIEWSGRFVEFHSFLPPLGEYLQKKAFVEDQVLNIAWLFC